VHDLESELYDIAAVSEDIQDEILTYAEEKKGKNSEKKNKSSKYKMFDIESGPDGSDELLDDDEV